jgi:hypothetical protein
MKKEKKDQIIRRISEQSMLKLTPMPYGMLKLTSSPFLITKGTRSELSFCKSGTSICRLTRSSRLKSELFLVWEKVACEENSKRKKMQLRFVGLT